MTQLEFYKSFLFVIELVVAEVLFTCKLERRKLFWLRLPLVLGAAFVFSWLFPVPVQNALYISFMFFFIFLFTMLGCVVLFKESFIKILYCTIAAYTVQHIAYEGYNIAQTYFGGSAMGFYGDGEFTVFPNPFVGVIYGCIYLVVYFSATVLLASRVERGEKLKISNIYIFVFAVLLFAIDIILNAVVVYYIAPLNIKIVATIVGVYNIVSCIVVLLLMFEVSRRYKLQSTLHTVNLLRRHEREQYAASKENIALINMKCHDLKHQVRTIGSRSALSEESVKEIENLISIYDSALHTGNDALDVIITEKLLSCNKNGIKISCIANGESLKFMREDDIYSLFGNLIDNAVEAVLPLDEKKRVISLKVREVNSMVSVNVCNFYEHPMRFENGLPVTTKHDKNYHGYGMQSVKYICGKYGGDLSINAENNVFNINLLFANKQREER